MKKYFVAFLLCAFPLFAGCPTAPINDAATTPLLDHAAAERAAFEARAAYGIAAKVAATYVNLPLCEKSSPPCATPALVIQIQKAQPVARTAIDASMDAARNPGFGKDIVNTSLAAAQSALKAFTTITDQLPKK